MRIYVDINAERDGDGSQSRPFRHIDDAARIAMPGDEVLVAPGIYREYVNPRHAGTEDARITYRSVEPLGAVITGAEEVRNWEPYQGDVWVARVDNTVFGDYNPYTTYVYGDWYFAGRSKHTGAVYLNDKAMYEAASIEACIKAEPSETSWEPEASVYQWYAEQNGGQTVIYANFQGRNPNEENVEINVRRECFMPSETGIGYITVSGFAITKAATTWAPPAAYQDGMIGPHWSKGWIIEDCEISNSKCAGISLGKYYDPDNDHYFTTPACQEPDPDGARRRLPRPVPRLAQREGRRAHHPPLQHPRLSAGRHHRTHGRRVLADRGQPHPPHQQHDGAGRCRDCRHQDARGHRCDDPAQLDPPLHDGHLVRLGGTGHAHQPEPAA